MEDLDIGTPRPRLYLGAPCRTEYTIARRNLFQIPSDEWRMAFSRRLSIPYLEAGRVPNPPKPGEPRWSGSSRVTKSTSDNIRSEETLYGVRGK